MPVVHLISYDKWTFFFMQCLKIRNTLLLNTFEENPVLECLYSSPVIKTKADFVGQ